MAVRTPLFLDGSDLKELSTAQVTEIVNQTVYQYSLNPSVVLNIVNNGGSLGTITDTRLQAGASATNVSAFPGEGSTAEPSVVTVNYSKINETVTTDTITADDGKAFPVYYTSSGHIQAMSLQDMKDTFLHPAIDKLVLGSLTTEQGGTYHVATSAAVTGSTNLGLCFADTKANVSAYTAAGIPEALDQPTTVQSYYLQRIDGATNTYQLPVRIRSDNDLQEYTDTDFETLLQNWIRYTAAASGDGYRIRYSYTTGTNRGSGMVDGRLNGSGNYQQRYINTDDYRAQEFPNGTVTTIATHYLKIGKS